MPLESRSTLSTIGLALAGLFVSPAPVSASSTQSANRSGGEAEAIVQDLRTIAIPGSTVKLALWNERANDGLVTPHYSISLDGEAVNVSTATDYSLTLRRATFDPLVAAPSFDKSMLPAGENIYIVQFVTQPLEEFRTALTQLGGTIYDYVGNHAYLVKLPGMARVEAGQLPFVRWIGNFHGEYRLDGLILEALNGGSLPPTARYNVVVFEFGPAQKELVASRIVDMGGSIDFMFPDGFRFEATLNAEMIVALTGMDEVAFIDPWGAPENDMDIARQIGGATYIEPLGTPMFDGTGVRGEVMDGGAQFNHPEFVAAPGYLAVLPHALSGGTVPNDAHGTCTTGEIFSHGVVNAQSRGLLSKGQGYTSSYQPPPGPNRFQLTGELVDPSLSFQCVFQSNSWGDPVTTQYTSKSQELDEIIFINDIIICQSMSNQNSQNARPQAWAKNMVSVGGVAHANTVDKADDSSSSATYGPAADGRIKPELTHFYDNIFTTDQTGNAGYYSAPSPGGDYFAGMNGTSGATPITAGHFGLFFQMWSQQIFNNPVPNPGGTVFENRCHAMTAKAFVVNNASPYNWLAGGAGGGLTRVKQGWGLADVRKIYDNRLKTFYVDESDVLVNLQTISYPLTVSAGTPELRATLCYREPGKTPPAAVARFNDLTLKLTSPGGTIYFGNNGLTTGLFSTPGGVANTVDTVENVFIQNPAAGTWNVQVIGSDINTDTYAPLTDPAVNATFALVVTGVDTCPTPATYCVAKINSLGCLPSISHIGTPSATAGSGFVVIASNALNNKPGLVIYGNQGQASIPFGGGTLCISGTVRRTPGITSGGSPSGLDCTGVFAVDMNFFAVGGMGGTPQPYLLVAGTVIDCQVWGRDSGFPAPNNVTLSNGLEYTICP